MLRVVFCLCVAVSMPLIGFELSRLSLDEKVGQMLIVHFHGTKLNDDAAILIRQGHVGGFIYYSWSNDFSSYDEVKNLSDSLQQAAPLPLFIAVDQEGGRVIRLRSGFSQCPSNRAVAEQGTPDLAKEYALTTGRELKGAGVNLNLAPVVDVNVNPNNRVIDDRSYGNTPDKVIAFAHRAIEGYAEAGILCSLKHFPGHGDVDVDSHEECPTINKTRAELDQMELAPFRALAHIAPLIMAGHIIVPAIDSEHPATTSYTVLNDLLREEMAFGGIIISDSMVMKGLVMRYSSIDEACVDAILAGNDLLILGGKLLTAADAQELTPNDVMRIHRYLVRAVVDGRISEERIDSAVSRILSAKKKYLSSF